MVLDAPAAPGAETDVGAGFSRPVQQSSWGPALAGPSIAPSGACPTIPNTFAASNRGPHRYFLTFCTWERARHFKSADHVSLVCEQFQRASREQSFAVIAYCFMPDHVHLLVAGERQEADLKRFSTIAKQYSGFYFQQASGLPLWQRYGFERVLRTEEATEIVARYTIANPVRAGLVQSPADYPFWGSFLYTRDALLEYVQRAG